MSQVAKLLGRNIKRLRKQKGLSQEAFAELAGYSRESLARLEGGGVWVSQEGLDRLAEKLGASFVELFSETTVIPFEKYDQESRDWHEHTESLKRENDALKTALQSVVTDRDRRILAAFRGFPDATLEQALGLVPALATLDELKLSVLGSDLATLNRAESGSGSQSFGDKKLKAK